MWQFRRTEKPLLCHQLLPSVSFTLLSQVSDLLPENSVMEAVKNKAQECFAVEPQSLRLTYTPGYLLWQ
jgi:hypothetical protein